MDESPFLPTPEGVRLAVRLTPRASRNGLDGVVQDAEGRTAVQIRLNAPPVEGAANKALIAFVARALGMRKSDISIRSGEKSRRKMLELTGDPDDLRAKLEAWLG